MVISTFLAKSYKKKINKDWQNSAIAKKKEKKIQKDVKFYWESENNTTMVYFEKCSQSSL